MCARGRESAGTVTVNAASLPRPAIPTRCGAPLAAMRRSVVTDGAVTMQSITAS